MAKTTVIVHRNAVDGRFVTPAYVKQNPRTTETEHRPKKGK
ncbi:MAG: hypothetical protein ABSB67_16035 [Bryobacteraceae bacterium]|jgi:hypothetical protein